MTAPMGTPGGYGYGYGPPPAPRSNRDGLISLICGIVGLFVLAPILGTVAIVFGVRGRRWGSGQALAGMILGIIDLVLWVVLLVTVLHGSRAYL
jgi:Zn-dependent protease with chaperone function